MALSYNYTNGTDIVENKSLDSYMGYIANLYDQKIELHRYYFHVDKEIDPWMVHFPLIKNNFNYTVNHRKMEY